MDHQSNDSEGNSDHVRVPGTDSGQHPEGSEVPEESCYTLIEANQWLRSTTYNKEQLFDTLRTASFTDKVLELVWGWVEESKLGDMLYVERIFIVRTAVKSLISSVERKVVEHKLEKVK